MNDAYNVSILDQVKTQIGYPADVRVFDNAIIPVVNSALAFLHQVGIGPSIPNVDSPTTPGILRYSKRSSKVRRVISSLYVLIVRISSITPKCVDCFLSNTSVISAIVNFFLFGLEQ